MASSPQQACSPNSVLLSFEKALRHKRNLEACIFCGHTQSTHLFKGKSVCLGCLKRILNLFPQDFSTLS